MKSNVWKKAYSLSFAFHIVIVITIGAMVAGFNEEIQLPKEQLITVDLADLPNDVTDENKWSDHMDNYNPVNDNDNQNKTSEGNSTIAGDSSLEQKNNQETKEQILTDQNGVLPYVAGANTTNTKGSYQVGSSSSNSGVSNSGSGTKETASGGNGSTKNQGTSSEDKYSVATRFARSVEAHKVYPYAAVRLNQEGTVTVSVTIDASGNLISANVISGVNGNLDKAALNAINKACPFPHGLGESITMQVPVKFYLN